MMYKAFFNALTGAALLALAGAAAADDLVLEDAWLRAVPPVSPTMAGYFTLRNDGDQAVELIGAKTDIAGMAMLHDTETTDDGQARMVHLSGITLEPGDEATFAPGGKHLMLMKVDTIPEAGESVEICLTFRDREDLCGDFPVRREAP
ncbi:copper chaperone PCu(A)C [Alloalcanivorax gelatiniphagus]|uniref:Copper chaperone PCu(A)C n=1 Tax=Alloalcanivorax gelatiniphagus TaxID=1194167 RepID=A0ABY2XJP2_9GAMM|nr:copper chaperone PCu(A)C [Alloalcanivorax gelatiniphagus]TMW12171.1 copper chaperone PCu(A)C [Alloalcanivorax gelatiniphagus]